MTAHHCRFRVYYEDTDAGGIVYHARYLGFAERARAEALRELGLPVGELARETGLGFVVRSLDVHYASALKLDEEMEVETVLKVQRGPRLHLEQRIFRLEPLRVEESAAANASQSQSQRKTLAVTLGVELVCVRLETMHPVRIPAHCAEKLALLLEEAPK